MTMVKLESFLSLTPSLVYLKLTGGLHMIDGQHILDGKRWEQFIGINLPQLDKFEFLFKECYGIQKTSAELDLFIGLFQTPFWIEHKKWFVTCITIIHLYSIP